MRHIAHHAFTNIADHDVDIKQSWLVRIFPSSPWRKIHRFQHVYMFFLYGIYTINWLILRDVRDTWSFNGGSDQERLNLRITALFTKAMYLIMMVLLPAYILDFNLGQVLMGFLVMHLTASYTVASVLASTHVGLAAAFPEPNERGIMPHSYERHQLLTTVDFATNNPLITRALWWFQSSCRSPSIPECMSRTLSEAHGHSDGHLPGISHALQIESHHVACHPIALALTQTTWTAGPQPITS